MSYFTGQLAPYFSGGSTTNGTPGGDRWAPVGRLSGCLNPFTESTLTALGPSQPEVECTNLKTQNQSRKIRNKSRRTLNTRRNAQQPGDRDHLETACDHTRPTFSPYSPASIDPGIVQIGLLQLSQSVKTTNVTHTQADRQTGRQTD